MNRVHADHAGVSVQLGPWKVLTTLPPGSLLASASNSLWIVIMRLNSFALSLIMLCMKVDFDFFFFKFCKNIHNCAFKCIW